MVRQGKIGFKIGTSVGIIILLLGIAVLFGIYQMSMISQDIIQISEVLIPINEIIAEINQNQIIQSSSFDKIIDSNQNSIDVEKAKQDFWFSGGVIDTQLNRAKKVIQASIETSKSDINAIRLESLNNRISSIENYHSDYEELAKIIFEEFDKENNQNSELLNEQISTTNEKIVKELNLATSDISAFTDSSIKSIEENESHSLYGQLVIIIAVGAIAVLLGVFINQINRDLQKEVLHKTEELRKANERLEKIDKMKNEFIGIASHELKSPIQPIIGFAELAKSGDIDQNEAWDGVSQLAQKLQDLANDVLDVSKIDNNQLKLYKEPLKINDIIIETINPIKINLKNISLQENLDENIEMELDRARFEQVLRNLISNAIKFTPNGTIIIDSHINKDENFIQITVSDNGNGIPNEVLPRIFEKFVTKSYGTQNGTGLGLFLCKGIIEAHGGSISAKNNENGGATIEFKLPITSKILNKITPKQN